MLIKLTSLYFINPGEIYKVLKAFSCHNVICECACELTFIGLTPDQSVFKRTPLHTLSLLQYPSHKKNIILTKYPFHNKLKSFLNFRIVLGYDYDIRTTTLRRSYSSAPISKGIAKPKCNPQIYTFIVGAL